MRQLAMFWNRATHRWCTVGGGGSALNVQVFHTTERTISVWVIPTLSGFFYKSFFKIHELISISCHRELCFSHHLPLSLFSRDYQVKDLHIVMSATCICVPEDPWWDLTHSETAQTRFLLHKIIKMRHNVSVWRLLDHGKFDLPTIVEKKRIRK